MINSSCTPPASMEVSQQKHYKEEHYQGVVHPRNGSHGSMPAQHGYPYYISRAVNHVMMPSLTQLHQKNIQDLQIHAGSSMIP